jgi:hypothetical protein
MPAFEEKSAPPIKAARVPAFAPLSCARRRPNSSTIRPSLLSRMRAALVAIKI